MKSTPTPFTHTALLGEPFTTTLKGAEVTVPAGIECHRLDGGSDPWVVSDLRFIENKHSMLYHDADHYGIRVPEDKLRDIYPVGMSRDAMANGIASLDAKKQYEIEHAIRGGACEIDRGRSGGAIAFLRGGPDWTGQPVSLLLSSLPEIAFAETELRRRSKMRPVYEFPNGYREQSETMYRRLAAASLTPEWSFANGSIVLLLSVEDRSALWALQEHNPATYGNAPTLGWRTLDAMLKGENRTVLEVLPKVHHDTRDEFVENKLVELATLLVDGNPVTVREHAKELRELCALEREPLREAMGRYPELKEFDAMKLADYDARQIRASDKVGKEYLGAVVGLTETHVVQSIGPKQVSHEKSALSTIPKEGDNVAIKYGKDRKAKVAVREVQGKEKQQGRSI